MTGSPCPQTDAEIERQMAAAMQAEDEGRHRTAAHLYDQLGKDIQESCGRFDSRALDAFEGVARVIGRGFDSEGEAQ
ncbi:hypothetical protein PV387_36280 [Streptomyces sp. ME02-6987-2C]|uniref:hypothetical protein n=1 Tax=unclassified Streptomyces TaxID=2593676 RepID=UPI0029B11182|nr:MULTISPECIES: hypothetical protein [unclassified Streptomyces]MDX3345943.1 hypothetical protein [Streptomyces sp. ME02-6979A]MDX3371399.1 hypothetical protein [Streptomyces sp. ME02-6987-2C]MDX3411618.1 hypothetical protein [Streptomyces sp. ME02-6977A]MDX3421709.1 hypothetical protein [Streptomyces sp. ME02-6985-2c]